MPHEHDPVWRQLAVTSNDLRFAPPTEVAWCECGALYVRGEWRLPSVAAASDRDDPLSGFPVLADDRISISVGPDGTPTEIQVRRVPCVACGHADEEAPPSGEELPVVRGALDAQADAEQRLFRENERINELRGWVLSLCDFLGKNLVSNVDEAKALTDAAREVTK